MSRIVDVPRTLCFHMLTEVLENKAYSNLVIQRSLNRSSLSAQDKKFAVALFYGTITRLYTLDYYLQQKLNQSEESLDPAVRTILRMGVWQILYAHSVPSFAAVDQMVTLSAMHTHEGGVRIVNAVLRVIAREFDEGRIQPEISRFDVRFSMNRELSGCLIKWYGQERAETIAAAYLNEASVTARVNHLRTNREDLVSLLSEEGVSPEDGLFMEDAIRLHLDGRAIGDLVSFQKGLFMIQDEAAILASYLLSPEPGQIILDVCAAPGGKSCHMAEMMRDKGQVLALDINESRLELIEQNKLRLGITSIVTKIADATVLEVLLPEERGTFHGVLVDVPCSGLGLLLRKPDIRTSMTYAKMQELIPLQRQILQQAAAFVRPGGTLIYSTCTINPHENEEQAECFLANHCDFEAFPFDDILPEKLKKRSAEFSASAARGYLQLLPDAVGCDGFFIARFRRKCI